MSAALVLIGGVPGTLKTSTAVALAARTTSAVAGTDELREVLRLYEPDLFLAGTTHTRWQLLGDYTPAHLVEGHRRQATVLRPAVLQVIAKRQVRGEPLVVEGVHLIPSLYSEGLRVLLVDHDPRRLRRRLEEKFPLRPDLAARWHEAKVAQLLELQEALVIDAHAEDALVLESESIASNVAAILAVLKVHRTQEDSDVQPA